MTGNTKAEILQIKDLKVVFFYSLNHDYKKKSSTDLLGLKVVYGDNKNLNFEYTSPYFKDFVLKVIEVYKEEKDANNITLMNGLTKELLSNLNTNSFDGSDATNNYNYQDRPVFEFSNRKRDLKVAKTYMKNVIKEILPFFVKDSDKEEILINEIKGYQNRFFAHCSNKYFDCLVPFILKKTDKNKYLFKIAGINQTSEIINGEIKIDGGTAEITWNIQDAELSGQEIFKFSGLHERSIFSFGEIIDFDNKVEEVADNEKEIIDFYLDLLGIEKMDLGIKVDGEKFVFGYKQVDEENIVTETSSHVFLSKKFINVAFVNKSGLAKYDNTFILPIFEINEDISIQQIKIEDEHYLLVQRHLLPTERMRGSYEEVANKYSYQLYKIKKVNNLLEKVEIEEEINLDNSVSSLKDIKKYVKRGEAM